MLNQDEKNTGYVLDEKPNNYFILPDNGSKIEDGGLRTKGIINKTEDDKPLVSIITISFNSSSTIEDAIKSVLKLPSKNIDYIIIDGGSNDSTVEKIKKYDDHISYWISECGNGIITKIRWVKKVLKNIYYNFDHYYKTINIRKWINTNNIKVKLLTTVIIVVLMQITMMNLVRMRGIKF